MHGITMVLPLCIVHRSGRTWVMLRPGGQLKVQILEAADNEGSAPLLDSACATR